MRRGRMSRSFKALPSLRAEVRNRGKTLIVSSSGSMNPRSLVSLLVLVLVSMPSRLPTRIAVARRDIALWTDGDCAINPPVERASGGIGVGERVEIIDHAYGKDCMCYFVQLRGGDVRMLVWDGTMLDE